MTKAAKIDTLIMRSLVTVFDKVVFPMGGHGLGTIGKRVARLRGHPLAEHRFENGGSFLYPNYDSYWGYYLRSGRPYEPDLRTLFTRLIDRSTRFAFIDGGANFGYWSSYLAQWPDLVDPIVAVEPTPETFAVLKRNGAGFTCIQAAISDKEGSVSLRVGAYHAGNRVVSEGGVEVPAVDVDGLVERYCSGVPVLVKLDVEGSESQAFAGARKTLDAGNAIIYECHGIDRDCSATRCAMSHGLAVYFLPPTGSPIRITDLDTLRELKPNRGMGYNLIAFRAGSHFEELIRH